MTLLLASLGLLLAGGFAALLFCRSGRNPSWLAVTAVVTASVLGCVPAIRVLLGANVGQVRAPWPVPYGEFFLEMDPLTAWFLVPLFLLSATAAVYGAGYWSHGVEARRLGKGWFFYCLLVFSMTLVLLARNAVLFLFAWELMALTSFFLVVFNDGQATVRRAGWIYLGMSQLSVAFLLALFLILGSKANSMDFTHWAWRGVESPALAGVLFVLAVLGFGAKAGFVPLHIWLPEAHPAAPSHVSALMSGVLIKTGIYGLLRALTFLGPPPLWWSWVLIGIGFSSGILGVLLALAQHDLKRLLAYHSVENIGIIMLGLGLGLLGITTNSPVLVLLGWGGGLLHVLNHALFKGLLFLGAGSVLHATGKRELDHLGGLLKRMPWTGATFLVGAAAISGLPPLNGFISELLIFAGAFKGVTAAGATTALPGLAVIAGLALIGGLAAACFTKAFGIVFLGEPRSEHAAHARESGWAMRGPMLLLAAGCAGVALLSPVLVLPLTRVVASVAGISADRFPETLVSATRALWMVVVATLVLLALIALLTFLRRWLLAGRRVTTAVTWDCGYAQPTARMQYTASSFVQPLTHQFKLLLRSRAEVSKPQGILPPAGSFHTHTPDPCEDRMYQPAERWLTCGLSKLRWLQRGNVQLYVLYVALTLLALLLWKLR
jgi:formate hydrogenlyase subunit 3/multisubunit Na+/H+ antiporter MnhD subunit